MTRETSSTTQRKPVSSGQTPLFKHGAFTSHSGLRLPDKIDCDALTEADWATNAAWVATRMKFGKVIGIPSGGLPFAKALERYATEGPTLIVDDVLTTGRSMEEARREHPDALGVVLFSRTAEVPRWITARFIENNGIEGEKP